MAEFVELMRLEELPPGKGTTVTVGARTALFQLGRNDLRHGGFLPPSETVARNEPAVPAAHDYDVTTGCTLHVKNYGVATYAVKLVEGKIMISVSEPMQASG
jgi:hypothetical protein